MALTLWGLAAPVAQAEPEPTIERLSWRELVSGASFVGVVECETAGELEARFRVVESWKGAPAGAHLRLRMATNNLRPRAPAALVGERALVTAFALSPSRVIGSGASGERVPLWFRKNHADAVLPLLQGWVPVPVSADADLLGSGEKTLEQLKARVAAFLTLPATEQEARVLEDASTSLGAAGPGGADVASLIRELGRCRSADASVAALTKYERAHPGSGYAVAEVIGRGAVETLAALMKLPPDERDDAVGEALDQIRERIPAARPAEAHHEAAAAPTPRMMEKMRDALAEEDARTWNGAISVLTVYDCDAVANALASWQAPARLPDYGFALGSWVAWRCGTNRAANLAHLADAAGDAWLRAWAATYLAIDDAGQGAARLTKLSQLPGDAGDWAALELARRGDRSGMPRVVALLSRPFDASAPLFRVQMRSRAAALLSNSAAESRVPAPPLGSLRATEHLEVDGAALQRWWAHYGPAVKLDDPWLPELVAEKVD
jgi:hypothetical protein